MVMEDTADGGEECGKMVKENNKIKIMAKVTKGIFLAAALLFMNLSLTIVSADNYLPNIHEPQVPEHPPLNIPGSYKTDLFPGAATYEYKIQVPPGVNGLQPEVSIAYNSHSASSNIPFPLGSGWTFTQNYIMRNQNYTKNLSDDTFTLVLNGRFYELVYDKKDDRYHTTPENFMEIKKIDKAWQARDTSGIYYFFDDFSDDGIKWLLNLIKDTNGNEIRYNYERNLNIYNDVNAVYLTEIEYNEGANKIEFNYGSSGSPSWPMYTNLVEERYTRELNKIITKVKGKTVKKYVLGFNESYDTKRSLITSIKDYGNGTDFIETKFSYEIPSGGWKEDSSWAVPEDITFSNEGNDTGSRLIDVNGDGLADIIRYYIKNGVINGTIKLNNGAGWTGSEWEFDDGNTAFVNLDNNMDLGVRFADLDGDIKIDILQCFNEAGSITKDSWLNNGGDGWVRNTRFRVPDEACFIDIKNITIGGDYLGIATKNLTWQDRGSRLVDINNDGRTDIIYSNNDSSGILINNGNGWETSATHSTIYSIVKNSEDNGVRFGDINGDSFVDVVGVWNYHYGDSEDVFVNTGDSWISSGEIPYEAQFVAKDSLSNFKRDTGVRLVDVNGDGLDDIIKGVKSESYIANPKKTWINKGTRWVNNELSWWEWTDYSPGWNVPDGGEFVDEAGRDLGVRFADVNGDGFVDLVKSSIIKGSFERKTWLNNAGRPYILKEVKNSIGGSTKISYVPSTSLNNTSQNGFSMLAFNLWVVNKTVEENGMNNAHKTSSITSYKYEGGFYDTDNRKFTGFRKTEEYFPNNLIVKNYFYQGEPRKSLEYKTEKLNSSGYKYEVDENEWNVEDRGGYFKITLNSKTKQIYDNRSSVIMIQDKYRYDDYGNVVEVKHLGNVAINNDNRIESISYDYNKDKWLMNIVKQRTITDPNGKQLRKNTYEYDSNGNLLSESKWMAESGTGANKDKGKEKKAKTEMAYDSYGNVISIKDARGYKTNYSYDESHVFKAESTNPLNHKTLSKYDVGNGNILSSTDSNGYTVSNIYDSLGRKVKEIMPEDSLNSPTKRTEYKIDGNSPSKIITMEKMNEYDDTINTYYFYDGLGRLIQINYGGTIAKDFYYDDSGKIVKESEPYSTPYTESYAPPKLNVNFTNYRYDALGRLTSVTVPDIYNSKTIINYDGLKISVINGGGSKTDYFRNSEGKITRVIEYNGDEAYMTQYNYDVLWQLTSIKNSYNKLTKYDYDTLGRMIKINDMDLGEIKYEYDENGNVIGYTDNSGTKIGYTYDALNRLTKKKSGNSVLSEYSYDVDKKGKLDKIKTSDYEEEYTYDSMLRIASKTIKIDKNSFKIQYFYDSLNNLVRKILPNGRSVFYTYEEGGRLKSIAGVLYNVNYTLSNYFKEVVYDNGLKNTFNYDALQRAIRITGGNLGGNSLDISYYYDENGNVIEINNSNEIYYINYDMLDRLTLFRITQSGKNSKSSQQTDIKYVYDRAGNIVKIKNNDASTYYTYNNANPHTPVEILELYGIANK